MRRGLKKRVLRQSAFCVGLGVLGATAGCAADASGESGSCAADAGAKPTVPEAVAGFVAEIFKSKDSSAPASVCANDRASLKIYLRDEGPEIRQKNVATRLWAGQEATLAFTLKNEGKGKATAIKAMGPTAPFQFKAAQPFPGSGGTCPSGPDAALEGGDSTCEFQVSFSPFRRGSFEDKIAIQYWDGASVQTASFALSASSVGCAPLVEIARQDRVDTDGGSGSAINSKTDMVAQSFILGGEEKIGRIAAYLYQSARGTTTGGAAEIRENCACTTGGCASTPYSVPCTASAEESADVARDVPSRVKAPVAGGASVSGADVPTSPGWVNFDFEDPPKLSAHQAYWMLFKFGGFDPNPNPADSVKFFMNSASAPNPYASGQMASSSDGFYTFTSYENETGGLNSRDLAFKIYACGNSS